MTLPNQTLQIATQLNAPLIIPVKSSFIKSLLIIVPHLAAMIFVFLLIPLPWFVVLIIIAVIGLSLFYYVRLHLWQRLSKSVITIHQDSTKNWALVCANKDDKIPVEFQASSFISPLLVILNFNDIKNKSYSVLLVPDSLPEQDFRRLRVRIRVQ